MKRSAAQVVRHALVRHAQAAPAPAEPTRVYILLGVAWGMGGTIRITLTIAGWLARTRPVTLISVSRGRDEPFFEFPPGVDAVALDDKRRGAKRPMLGRRLGQLPSVLMQGADGAARGFDLCVDLQLVRAVRRRAGVLLTTRPGYNLIAATLRPPGLAAVGVEPMHLGHHPPGLRKAMLRTYGRMDALVVLTRADPAAYRERLPGPRIVQIPKTSREMRANADQHAKHVLAAGRLGPQKGFDLLIRAGSDVAARHPDWSLKICGSSPGRNGLQRRVADGLEDVVELAPPASDLGAEMAAAAVYVLSSGIVSFDCPTGPGELVEDRVNGLLVAPRDVDVLAKTICTLIEDPELLARCLAGVLRAAEAYQSRPSGRCGTTCWTRCGRP